MSYPIRGEPTSFQDIYDRFFGSITDDTYMEMTKEETEEDVLNILLQSIPGFEFPRFPLYDYDKDAQEFHCHLTEEEVNIFALLMYNTWLQRQIASCENVRMKYSGPDQFKVPCVSNGTMKTLGRTGTAETPTRAEVTL